MRPYLRAANVGLDGLLLDDVMTMNFTDEEMNVYRLRQGDIVLGEASGSAKEVGKPAIWNDEVEDCAFQNTLLRVRPHSADSRFLLHFFQFQAGTGGFASRSRGVGIHHLGRESLATLPTPVPPIEEQRRIADILDRADALRAKRREALALLDDLTQSIFLDMFGQDSPAVGLESLGDVAEIQIGPFGSLLHAEDYILGGVPLINPMHIVDGRSLQIPRTRLVPRRRPHCPDTGYGREMWSWAREVRWAVAQSRVTGTRVCCAALVP